MSDATRPLLTLAIPTYNRADTLDKLLTILLPQLAEFPGEVELIVSDNASPDNTLEIVELQRRAYDHAGIPFHIIRNPQNLGPDGNFLGCFRRATGTFFWICGDDDLIVPGGVAQVLALLRGPGGQPADIDLVYTTSYSFRDDYLAEQQTDPYGRNLHTITDARRFVQIVNIMFTFVGAMIVNRDRLATIPHEDPKLFAGTNLIQLSWVLPLLTQFRKAYVLWTRPIAARQGHANGYSLGKVFGENLIQTLHRALPSRPALSETIINFALRRWFPDILLELRINADPTLRFQEAPAQLRAAYRSNIRFWIFTWPVLVLPLPLARLWQKAGSAFSKVVYAVLVPGFWRKQT